jgi:hypothetical protein
MTRQALAELSALLAQRAVLAPPSQVAKDALKLARYADAAKSNADKCNADGGTYHASATKRIFLRERAAVIANTYGFHPRVTLGTPSFRLVPLPNTPPIQGYPEGYAI